MEVDCKPKEVDSKPKGETGAIEVPRRERVKRGPTTARTRRSRSLMKTPDLCLNIARLRPMPDITCIYQFTIVGVYECTIYELNDSLIPH